MSQNDHLSISKSLSLPPCVFSCRIVQIDYYLSAPLKNLDVCFSSFRSSPVEKVPVLRVFGATPAGQKTCLHIHGSFPYLLVPCVVAEPTDSYLQQLARSIDHALQVSLGASSRTINHVFKIVVVKGMYVVLFENMCASPVIMYVLCNYRLHTPLWLLKLLYLCESV